MAMLLAVVVLVLVLQVRGGSAAGAPPYCGPGMGETEGQWREKMLAFRRSFTNSSSTSTGGGGGAFCSADPASLYHRNKDFIGSTFTCTLTMLSDRYLYNEATHQWTVGRFLSDLEERYGGADCVLLWQSYTNMGVDEKNQIDLIRVAPGGVAGVKALIAQLHAANVSVLFPWNQWASGNLSYGPRAEPDFDFVQLLAEVAADGFNTDSGGRSAIPGQTGYKPSQPAVHGFDGNTFVAHGLTNFPMGFNKHDLLNQPEHGAGCPAGLTMGGWAGEGAGPGPGYNGLGNRAAACVECAKWLEPRHKTQWVGRNDVLRQPALKWAFFNGNGYSTWESVWGNWNGISEKDGETMRRIFTILRQFRQHVSSCDFRPFHAVNASKGVEARATLFPLVNTSSGVSHEWLLTVISNTASPTSNTPLGSYNVTVPADSSRSSAASASRFFDVWQGRELHPATMLCTGNDETISLHLTGQIDEYSAVAMVTAETAASPTFTSFLAKMRKLTATPLGPLSTAQVPSFDYHFNVNGGVIGTAKELVTAAAAATATDSSAESPPPVPPVATVQVPLTHGFHFQVQNLLWENYLFVKYPFGPQNNVQKANQNVVTVHSNLTVGAFNIDKYPVTNEEFASFLAASNYTPADPINFLKSWGGGNATSGHQKRTPPIGSEKKPVVHVGFEDAQQYCSFYKRRLPNEWEWSLAAGAFDNRRWPWGNSSETAAGQQCMPPSYNGLGSPPLPDVDQFDKHGCGAPSGMQLSVGSIWQWTNSLQDAHQRTGLIKGGSNYWRANVTKERSVYFFPNCAKEQWVGYGGRTAKVMPLVCQGELYLQDGGSERSSTIGFRCAGAAGPLQPFPAPSPPPIPSPHPSHHGGGDLRWYGGDAAGAYSWHGGQPTASATAVHSGVFSYTRTFQLDVQMASGTVYLYVGAHQAAGTLTATVKSSKTVVQKTTPHSASSVNVVFEISWRSGPIRLRYSQAAPASADDHPGGRHVRNNHAGAEGKYTEKDENKEDGDNITWQSAALAPAPKGGCSDGATICMKDPTVMGSKAIDLSKIGSIDWVHWGGVVSPPTGTSVWSPVVKESGPRLLKATLV